MRKDLKDNYKKIYAPLWNKFLNDIMDVNVENCPEPHFPIYGEEYINSKYKIAFVGIDTKGSCGLGSYKTKEGYLEIIDEWKGDEGFDDLSFRDWEKNGSVFWKFIFKFLAIFNNVDLHELKECTNEELRTILKSFIWGNVCSIEGFNVTAKDKGVRYQDWEKVKNASVVFDKLDNVLNVFSPKIIVLLNWNAPDEWFLEGMGEPEKYDPIPLWYYFIEKTQTHLYWTKHPRALVKIGFDEVIYTIVQSIKDKNIFQSFPGEKIFEVKAHREIFLKEIMAKLTQRFKKERIECQNLNCSYGDILFKIIVEQSYPKHDDGGRGLWWGIYQEDGNVFSFANEFGLDGNHWEGIWFEGINDFERDTDKGSAIIIGSFTDETLKEKIITEITDRIINETKRITELIYQKQN